VSCEEYRSALTDVALGTPAPPALDSHLAVCLRCRAALEEARRLLGRIDGEVEATLQVAPSAGFLARVRQRTEEPRAFRGWWLIPAAVAAAVALIALLRPSPAPLAKPPAQATVEVTPPTASPLAVTPAHTRRVRRPPAEPAVLVPLADRQALARYLDDLHRQRTIMWAARVVEIPATSLAPLPTQTAVATIEAATASPAIEIRPIQIAPIGVQPLTMESWNEE
jgi:hypothetical protein